MKHLNYISSVLLILLSLEMQAKWPGNSSFLTKNKTGISETLLNTSSIFAEKGKVSAAPVFVLNAAGALNSGYITGLTKKTDNTVVRLLNWDFKVKFRLNRNMNIIFSYN